MPISTEIKKVILLIKKSICHILNSKPDNTTSLVFNIKL